MAGSAGLEYVVNTARRVWEMEPHRHVRIPPASKAHEPVAIDALWTDYALRPSATDLAFMVQAVPQQVWSSGGGGCVIGLSVQGC